MSSAVPPWKWTLNPVGSVLAQLLLPGQGQAAPPRREPAAGSEGTARQNRPPGDPPEYAERSDSGPGADSGLGPGPGQPQQNGAGDPLDGPAPAGERANGERAVNGDGGGDGGGGGGGRGGGEADGKEDDEEEDEREEEIPDAGEVLDGLTGLLGDAASIGTGDVRVQGQNATGHGATAIGTFNVNTIRGGPEGEVWCQALSATLVREMVEAYAPAPTDDRLDNVLRRRQLVCLSGQPGSGRYTSACLALARRYGVDRVGIISATRFTALTTSEGLLRAGFGYLFPLDDGRPAPDGLTMVKLASWAQELGCTIVLTGQFDQYDQEVTADLVEHRPPAPVDVFRSRLGRRLRGHCLGGCADCVGVCLDGYLDECVTQPPLGDFLAGVPRPGEVARVVESIAGRLPRGAALAELLDRLLPEQLRQRAREILDPADGPAKPDLPGGTDQLRAFRLACAVFDGQPVPEILRAAERLLPAYPVEPGTARLRQPDLDQMLGVPLRHAVVISGGDLRSGVRTVRFTEANSRLRASLLDVAWQEWGIADRLLAWFGELARSGAPAIRRAAAGAIGWSAGHGPDPALAMVGQLARERQAGLRQVAGIALVAMAMQPALQHRVRTELDRWAEGTAYQRDTVARAYGLGLARLWPDAALTQLHRAAQGRLQRRNNSVVRGLVEVYQSGRPELVVTELARWATSPQREVRLHAARTLRVCADRWLAPPRAYWPELLDLVRADVLRLADVAALWALALSLPETAYRSWRTLGYWLNRADGQPEVARACLDLIARTVAGDRALRRRLSHQVRHVWRPIMPGNALLFQVARLAIEE